MNDDPDQREVGLITFSGTYLKRGDKYFRVIAFEDGIHHLGDEVPWAEVWRRPDSAMPMVPIIHRREP